MLIYKNKSQRRTASSLLIFCLLLTNVLPLNWQGYGNISASNLTDIWEYIDSNIGAVQLNNTVVAYQQFVKGFSDHLNEIWHPAWNVAFSKDATVGKSISKDMVVYGYAFRNHWMWYSGYLVKNTKLNFVLWKDYNCQKWVNIGDGYTTSQGFTSAQQTSLAAYQATLTSSDFNNIWLTGKKIVDVVPTLSAFSSSGVNAAYSIIISQEYYNSYYGRICSVQNKVYFRHIYRQSSNFYGFFFLFQTR